MKSRPTCSTALHYKCFYKPLVITAILLFTFFSGLSPKTFAQSTSECPNGTTLNIVAHADDDLLFLNPDVYKDIQANKCVITLYVTAGDANENSDYWSGREEGLREAYADMWGASNNWTSSSVSAANKTLQTYKLNNSDITLVFMRLPDGNYYGEGFSNNNYESLKKLYQGNIGNIHALDGSETYTKNNLIDTITAVMDRYKPGTIRTQDFQNSYDADNDHSDHLTVAYVAFDAHENFDQTHTFIGYMGYGTSSKSENVTGSYRTMKQNTFFTYAEYDYKVCQSVSACDSTNYGPWLKRQYTVGSINTQGHDPEPEEDAQEEEQPPIGGAPTQENNEESAGTENDLLGGSTWTITGNNGSNEKDKEISSDTLNGKNEVSVTFDLHGTTFGTGDDEASIIFIQNGAWKSANLAKLGINGLNGTQTLQIPLSSFHQIGNASNVLDPTESVSNVHARFWHRNAYSVDIKNIVLVTDETTQTASVVPTVTPTPVPTATPTPSTSNTTNSTSDELLSSGTWTITGNNGSSEKDLSVSSNILSGKKSVQVEFDLKGKSFGSGDDEASVIFIQNGAWMAANLVEHGENSKNGTQKIKIALSDFHKVGDSSKELDTTKSVSNIHARFWNSTSFTVEISSIKLLTEEVENNVTQQQAVSVTPTPTPNVTSTPTPAPTPTVEQEEENAESEETSNLLEDDDWNIETNGGADEADREIDSDSLHDKDKVEIKIDLNGTEFGDGDDQASIIFIQNDTWYAANVTKYLEKDESEKQTIEISLDEFHKVGDDSKKLDTEKNVSNIHARFWNKDSFSVEITSIELK